MRLATRPLRCQRHHWSRAAPGAMRVRTTPEPPSGGGLGHALHRPPRGMGPVGRFKTSDTRLGRLLFPGLVFLAAAYLTFTAGGLLADRAAWVTRAAGGGAGDSGFSRKGVVEGGGVVSLSSSPPFTRRDVGTQVTAGADAGAAASKTPTIHVVFTSNGSPYLNWQTRLMYATFKEVQATPEGRHMKYFTRLLHRRTDDELMGEVPTVRVDSLHAACDRWCEFPVADRPDAVQKWLQSDDSRLGDWLYLVETDYIWRVPVPSPPLPPPGPSSGVRAYTFHFHYINPLWPGVREVLLRMEPKLNGDVSKIPCAGPAPAMITRPDLELLTPDWVRLAAWIEGDAEAKDKLGWVREMYAYDVAAHINGVLHEVQDPGSTWTITQPPADEHVGKASAFHYTWGAQFKNASGGVVWEFDKRPYVETRHVRRIGTAGLPSLPPADSVEKGYKLQDGKPVTAALLAIETDMVATMRRACAGLPDLPDAPGCGWQDGEPECSFGCAAGVLCTPPGRTFKLPDE